LLLGQANTDIRQSSLALRVKSNDEQLQIREGDRSRKLWTGASLHSQSRLTEGKRQFVNRNSFYRRTCGL